MPDHETDRATDTAGESDADVVVHEETPAPDWMGNRLARDEELVDEMLEQHHGDVEAAERDFEVLSDEAEQYDRQHEQGPGNQPWTE